MSPSLVLPRAGLAVAALTVATLRETRGLLAPQIKVSQVAPGRLSVLIHHTAAAAAAALRLLVRVVLRHLVSEVAPAALECQVQLLDQRSLGAEAVGGRVTRRPATQMAAVAAVEGARQPLVVKVAAATAATATLTRVAAGVALPMPSTLLLRLVAPVARVSSSCLSLRPIPRPSRAA